MSYYGDCVTRLIEEFNKLPGVGHKSAQRLAFHVLNMDMERVKILTSAIIEARKNSKFCEVCCNLTDKEICNICKSGKRDTGVIMVVEDPRDMAAYEKIGEFDGKYHVLGGRLSPMNGVGPDEIRIKELLKRLDTGVSEVILATNPNVEGEATAMYISRLIKPLGISVTRIAHGVPVGSDLEHVDGITLSRALTGRREM